MIQFVLSRKLKLYRINGISIIPIANMGMISQRSRKARTVKPVGKPKNTQQVPSLPSIPIVDVTGWDDYPGDTFVVYFIPPTVHNAGVGNWGSLMPTGTPVQHEDLVSWAAPMATVD